MSELAHDKCAVVSSESELLILVDENDVELSPVNKATCHDGGGMLHRAFSVLIFNSKGELLLQKRAPGKRLWGDFWSNSCCSHPRWGETMHEASRRRLWEELGLRADLTFLYKFQYHADFGKAGAEHELCWVYIGLSDEHPSTNFNEVSEWRYISAEDLNSELDTNSQVFTPWFKMEWQAIQNNYQAYLSELLAQNK